MLTSALNKDVCETNMRIIVVKVTELGMKEDEWVIDAYSDEVMGWAPRQTTEKKNKN